MNEHPGILAQGVREGDDGADVPRRRQNWARAQGVQRRPCRIDGGWRGIQVMELQTQDS